MEGKKKRKWKIIVQEIEIEMKKMVIYQILRKEGKKEGRKEEAKEGMKEGYKKGSQGKKSRK